MYRPPTTNFHSEEEEQQSDLTVQ